MIKRCKHEYVNTADWLPKEIGPCCKKCGKPLVKHEYFSYWWRTKKAFKLLFSAWGRFKEIDYHAALDATIVLMAFVILVAGYFLAPFLALFLAPLFGFVGWVNVNKELRGEVKNLFGSRGGEGNE